MLEFGGDGDNGLLGYSCSLQNLNAEIFARAVVDRERSDSEIVVLQKSLEATQQQEQQIKSRM